ncbi:MAG: CPBP family intramembrane glutamic endopeptidase [Planctomycetota bacterium]
MQDYRSADHRLPFVLLVVALGPLVEELLFRGFVIPGLRSSWLGAAGAVLITVVT